MIPWKTSLIPLTLCSVALVAAFVISGWGVGLFIAVLILLVFLVDLCVSLSRKNNAQRATGRSKGSRTDTDDSGVTVPVIAGVAVADADVANDGKDSSGGFWSSVGDFFSGDSSSGGGGGYSGGDSGGGDGGGGGGGGD